MKVKFLVGALIVLVLMNLAALGSFFYMQHHAPAPRRGERAQRWMSKNLPDQDRREFVRTVRGIRKDIGPLAESTRVLEKQLIDSMREDPVPRARIDSLLQEISRNRLDMARRATDRMITMGDSLTPEERGRMVDAILRARRLDGAGHRRDWRNRD